MATDVAVERLLAYHGIACTRGEFLLLRDGRGSAEEVVEELRVHGVIARVVTIGDTGLRTLRLPTLAQLHGGEWFLIRSRTGTRIEIETKAGADVVSEPALAARLSGIVLDVTPRLALPGRLWSVMIKAALPEARWMGSILAITFFAQLLALLPPQFTRIALDAALPQGAGSMLNTLVFGLVFAGAFQAWTAWLRQRALLFLRVRLQVVVERGFVDHILRLAFGDLRRRTASDFLQGLFGVAEARNLIIDRSMGLFLDGAMSVAYLGAMAASLPAPTAGVTLAGVTIAIASIAAGRVQAHWQRVEVEAQLRQRAFLIESLQGIATVKGMGAEKSVLQRWVQLLANQLTASWRRQRVGLSAGVLVEGLRQALTFIVMIGGGYLALQRKVTLGGFVAFMQMSGGFLGSIFALASGATAMLVLRPQLSKTAEFFGVGSSPLRRSVARAVGGTIQLEDVWFRYGPEGPWILSEYQLRVEAGEKRWIKGPSGWGKTTLLRLIAGLYAPERGRVRIGGHDPAKIRGQVLLIPQSVHIFGGTIDDNLRVLSGYAPRERLFAAAEASGLAAFVSTLAMGYETTLSPGGWTLSGGQRQLIAVTAAMASTHPVLLLDEAFVNLDGGSRSWLVESPWFETKTVIYVGHDLHFTS